MFASRLQGAVYRHCFKPIAFRFDAESVHDCLTKMGAWMGRHPSLRKTAGQLWHYEHPALRQQVCGISFENPVGLTAGFDKDGLLTDILPEVGFGFAEIGSVTGRPCSGNPRPRLWRLPHSRALLVYYGLKNEGCETVAHRLAQSRRRIPLGVSIARTNDQIACTLEMGVEDYRHSFKTVEPVCDYLTVNISCPNAFGGEPFTHPDRLDFLLRALDEIQTIKPVFLKMPADLSLSEAEELATVALTHRVHGFIFSNLTKRRDTPAISPRDSFASAKGGISGRPVFEPSNRLLKHFYRSYGARFTLIGSGGVFSADDAYEKICSGATLIQLATGMIFEGPQVIGQINKGVVERLERDGFTSVSQAVGAYLR
ncbi:quinone-dependent dihydroorotate dehydrogenase [Candidatus Uhrbacteria bacterium]|nr:quinone-dependent dihydroorotate dehydrogenase [Candidatus Uhrbacteria bacterium]